MESNKEILSDFVQAVKKACEETGEKLPKIVENWEPGDEKLYRNISEAPVFSKATKEESERWDREEEKKQYIARRYEKQIKAENNQPELEIW